MTAALRLTMLLFCLAMPTKWIRAGESLSPDKIEFFERKVRPLLVQHCYECHSDKSAELKGGLRLDLQEGWRVGGESGNPAIVPGSPEKSPLLHSIRQDGEASAMPPTGPKLSNDAIDVITHWIEMGAPDPRDGKLEKKSAANDWESLYQERLKWWSLQPIKSFAPPTHQRSTWSRNEVDRFIEDSLTSHGLHPAKEADKYVLARRLHFALTGLPPTPDLIDQFVNDPSTNAFEKYVASVLESPHFGEHWARHWLDVVHYSDTHGYEWDVPTKNSWMYRDYVVRAFNHDLPIDRFFLEQLAGDLIEPRVDSETRRNESLIATMALRLGERRHGDSAAAEGVTQEAIANVIDTVSKGFLGTTVACAQCHDHKLDAVAQSDFYALAGMFMSSRWHASTADAVDPNKAILAEMSQLKSEIRHSLADRWLNSKEAIRSRIVEHQQKESKVDSFPQTIGDLTQRMKSTPITAEQFTREQSRRTMENKTNSKLIADFTREDGSLGWRWDGSGMKHGLVRDGEIVISVEGSDAILQVLPAGRWSHVWSDRLAAALRSPLMDVAKPYTLSIGLAGGKQAAWTFAVDHAFHSERLQFFEQPLRWLTVTAGNFDTLEGSIDKIPRRVYFEITTKSLNNYYPPRTGYGGVKEQDLENPRSWFGVTKIYEHPPGKPPLDELSHLGSLFAREGDWSDRIVDVLCEAIDRWKNQACTAEDAQLIDESLQVKWLDVSMENDSTLRDLVTLYRQKEKSLKEDQTIGTMSDWVEGRDERIGIRGSYTDLGEIVPRGNIRFLGGARPRAVSASSGRLEFAKSVIDPSNPLAARVYVNRVWHHLFGEALVRTPDDFGHLGEKPSHPELLDYLADRFIKEGWSQKKLITMLVCSATWRQDHHADSKGLELDPDNRLWHYRPIRRLEAESIRDAMLFVSGRLDASLYGPPINPYRTAQDSAKRLFAGPIDGNGRRSLYTKMTLMEPPRFLALFNQPIPKLTTGKRDVTNVPDQALALLNDPFVVEVARHWGDELVKDHLTSPEVRAARMFERAMGRPAKDEEIARLVRMVKRSAELRGKSSEPLLECSVAWQDAAHAIFNMKEFIYVP